MRCINQPEGDHDGAEFSDAPIHSGTSRKLLEGGEERIRLVVQATPVGVAKTCRGENVGLGEEIAVAALVWHLPACDAPEIVKTFRGARQDADQKRVGSPTPGELPLREVLFKRPKRSLEPAQGTRAQIHHDDAVLDPAVHTGELKERVGKERQPAPGVRGP